MTLMPVSKISTLVDCSTNCGGARWMGMRVLVLDGRAVVDRLADDVEDAPQALRADRHGDGPAGVAHHHPADEAVGGVHGDGADGVLAEVLRDLEREVVLGARDAGVGELEGVQDLRELALGELDVDDGADDLDHLAVSGGRPVRSERERGLGHGAFRVGRRVAGKAPGSPAASTTG